MEITWVVAQGQFSVSSLHLSRCGYIGETESCVRVDLVGRRTREFVHNEYTARMEAEMLSCL